MAIQCTWRHCWQVELLFGMFLQQCPLSCWSQRCDAWHSLGFQSDLWPKMNVSRWGWKQQNSAKVTEIPPASILLIYSLALSRVNTSSNTGGLLNSKQRSQQDAHCLFFFLLKVVRSGSVPLLFKWKCYLKYLILPRVGGGREVVLLLLFVFKPGGNKLCFLTRRDETVFPQNVLKVR